MISLSIDIGNHALKLGVFESGDLQSSLRFDSIIELSDYCKQFDAKTPAIISSVTNANLEPLATWFRNLLILDEHTKWPLTINYKTPQTLGKDRLAAALGAMQIFPFKNCLIIDAGTAITYDFMTKNGEFMGGSIAPGLEMKFKALHQFTQKLPLISKTDTISLTGGNTEEAIQSGVMLGSIMEMQGFIDAYTNQYNSLQIIMTGGDHTYFVGKLKGTIFAEPDLVLKGLFELLKYNAHHS